MLIPSGPVQLCIRNPLPSSQIGEKGYMTYCILIQNLKPPFFAPFGRELKHANTAFRIPDGDEGLGGDLGMGSF